MSADMLIYGLSAFCDDTCRKVFTDKAVERTRAKQQSKAKRVHREKDKAFKRETRERKEAIKPRGDYIKAAQKEFNRFIRLRDNDQPCISCGRDASQVEPTDGWKPGGAWDCGHFQGVGRRPELRFTETNAYRQCKSCNGGSGKYARKSHTVEQEYEERLRVRIGDAEVDRLKGPAPPAKWTIDDIKAIQTKYRLKANILEKALDL
jgi:hypothetical protein